MSDVSADDVSALVVEVQNRGVEISSTWLVKLRNSYPGVDGILLLDAVNRLTVAVDWKQPLKHQAFVLRATLAATEVPLDRFTRWELQGDKWAMPIVYIDGA